MVAFPDDSCTMMVSSTKRSVDMNNEHVRKTIEEMVSQISTLERQLAKKRSTVNDLCEHMGEPPMFAEVAPAVAGTFGIQSDLYYTKPLATSARDVLQRRKAAGLGAMSLDELYTLMVKGGFKFEAKNDATAKRSLATALSKNPAFTRLPNDDIGLTEWYDLPAKSRGKPNGNKATAESPAEGATESVDAETDPEYRNDFADEGDRVAEKEQPRSPAKK
jgi:hypothetical protein